MKNLILVVFLISILFLGCDKKEPDPVSANNLGPNLVEKNITASEGGSLSTSSGIRLDIPAGALNGSGTVTLGVTGNESSSISNSAFQIANTPFTIKLPATSISSPLTLSFPLGSLSASADKYNLFLYNGTSYYPFEYSISGNTVTGTIDKIDWETSSLSNGPEDVDLLMEFSVYFLLKPQVLLSNQQGLKKVTISNGLQFSEPNAPSGSKNLLFIHGLNSSPDTWDNMINKFSGLTGSPYSQIWTFGYNTAMSISSNAAILKNALASYCSGKKVDIIAHSMGGLVARYLIEKSNGKEYVNKLVTLGTPHSGSPLATLRALVGGLTVLEGFPGMLSYYFATQGLGDLKPGSSFLNQLATLSNPPVPYYIVAAKNNPSRWWASRNTFLLPGDDDGAVTVTSALAVPNVIASHTVTIDEAIAHFFLHSNDEVYNKVISWLIGSQQTGKISGQISDATSGNGLSGVTVSLKQLGTTISTTTSNSSGYYEFTNVAVGSYEVAVSKFGYISTSTTGVSVGSNQTTTTSFSMSPMSSNIAYRIVLTWGSSPADLDAHLLKGGYHIYWDNKGSLNFDPFAQLDVDDMNSFGPETITIAKLNSQSSKFYVFNYSGNDVGDTDLKQSGAVVKIYSGSSLVKTYNVPPSGTGFYWYVCDISSGGTITDRNILTNTPPQGAPNKVEKKIMVSDF